MSRYTKDEYEKRYYELLELTGDKDKAGLLLTVEHNRWSPQALAEIADDLEKKLKRQHLTLVPID